MKKIEIPHLASAVTWWLNYITAVGRNYIISESTIKIPVTEYLERVLDAPPELEYGHPKLWMKRFDLFFKDNNKTDEIAFEFKYVKDDSTRDKDERKRIFYDIMRLHLFAENSKKGYFLICGNQTQFNLSFQNLMLKPTAIIAPVNNLNTQSTPAQLKKKSFYAEWFSFDEQKPDMKIDLTSKDALYEEVYQAFQSEYKKPYKQKMNGILPMPKSVTTKLVFLSQEMTPTNIPQTIKIGIWEIGA